MVKFSWSKFRRGVFLVNCLAIVYNPKTGKILIGKRERDPYVKNFLGHFRVAGQAIPKIWSIT
jgi:hypothetical protein